MLTPRGRYLTKILRETPQSFADLVDRNHNPITILLQVDQNALRGALNRFSRLYYPPSAGMKLAGLVITHPEWFNGTTVLMAQEFIGLNRTYVESASIAA